MGKGVGLLSPPEGASGAREAAKILLKKSRLSSDLSSQGAAGEHRPESAKLEDRSRARTRYGETTSTLLVLHDQLRQVLFGEDFLDLCRQKRLFQSVIIKSDTVPCAPQCVCEGGTRRCGLCPPSAGPGVLARAPHLCLAADLPAPQLGGGGREPPPLAGCGLMRTPARRTSPLSFLGGTHTASWRAGAAPASLHWHGSQGSWLMSRGHYTCTWVTFVLTMCGFCVRIRPEFSVPTASVSHSRPSPAPTACPRILLCRGPCTYKPLVGRTEAAVPGPCFEEQSPSSSLRGLSPPGNMKLAETQEGACCWWGGLGVPMLGVGGHVHGAGGPQ